MTKGIITKRRVNVLIEIQKGGENRNYHSIRHYMSHHGNSHRKSCRQ
jgi:hypothetical protein